MLGALDTWVQGRTTINSKLVAEKLGLPTYCFTNCDSCRLREHQGAKLRAQLSNTHPHQITFA